MIKRTFNNKVVQNLLSDPKLLRRSGCETVDVFDPENQRNLYYLLAIEGGDLLGLVLFHMQNKGCYQGHINYSPKFWGQRLEKYTREAIDWMFRNTDCEKIFAFVPAIYPEIKRHALLAGMKVEGTLENSYRVGEAIYSQYLMGIDKNK